MIRPGSSSVAAVAVAILASAVLGSGLGAVAHAQSTATSSVKDASKHFQRGVALYNEADYRAALVEFRRAYDVAPNAAVLYNIGQTYYQLQNYAAALVALERYLAESGATAPHRREVEQTLEILQARVGKIAVTTNAADCEITIDDELVGRTPLTEPVLVSIGRRKVTAMRQGSPAETRFVDVAAGDIVKLSLSLTAPNAGASSSVVTAPGRDTGRSFVTAGWVTTGLLGAAAITTGVLAYKAASDLKTARDTFPASRNDLDNKQSRVTKLSVATDILGVATIVAGGLSLKLTLSRGRSSEVQVAVAPHGIQIAGVFP